MAPNVGLGTQGQEHKGWPLWIISVVGVVLAALFVAARLAQRYLKSKLGLDDYMIIASLIASGLLSLTECQAVVHGYGRRWRTLQTKDRLAARKWFYAAQIMYKVVSALNKVSVVALYRRIFAMSSRRFDIATHVANIFIIASGLAYIIGTIFQCNPIAAFWDKSIVDKKCFKEGPWWASYATIQIATDVFLLILPIKMVIQLSMSRMDRIGLCLIFATGGFVTFASIFRATTLARSTGTDPTWDPIPATIWSVIEANAGIICACLPMLRQPFARVLASLFRSNAHSSREESYDLSFRIHQGVKQAPEKKRPSFVQSSSENDRDSEKILMSGKESLGSVGTDCIMVKNEVIITRHAAGQSRQANDLESDRDLSLHL